MNTVINNKASFAAQGTLIFNFNHMDKKFTKGLLIGALIGGAAVGIAQSKRGKEMRAKIMKSAEEIFVDLRKQLEQLTAVSKEKFNELAERAVEEYARQKELALEMKDKIVDRLREKWEESEQKKLFKEIKRRFTEAGEKTEAAYRDLVEEMGGDYVQKRGLGFADKSRLMRELKKRWDEMKESLE